MLKPIYTLCRTFLTFAKRSLSLNSVSCPDFRVIRRLTPSGSRRRFAASFRYGKYALAARFIAPDGLGSVEHVVEVRGAFKGARPHHLHVRGADGAVYGAAYTHQPRSASRAPSKSRCMEVQRRANRARFSRSILTAGWT